MIVKVVLFAAAKEIAETGEIELSLADSAKVGDLKCRLVEEFPAMKGIVAKSAISVDQEYSNDLRELHDGAEVGLIPPVSGG